MKTGVLIIYLGILLFIMGCKSGSTSRSADAISTKRPEVNDSVIKNTQDTLPQPETKKAGANISFLLPSPDEILSEIFADSIIINLQLVNPQSNAAKYITVKSQALNLGVYIADFAYLNLNNNKTSALDYFKIIRDLAQKLNIYGLFNESLYNRIRNNITNKDTLNEISKEMYYNMLSVLENANRNNIYALISSGALIESLYLSTMVVSDYSQYQSMAQKIFEQKYIISNFYDFASQYDSDADVKAILVLFDELKKILESSKTKTTEKKVRNDKQNHIIIGGGEEIILNEPLFKAFKEKTIKTRQEITRVSNK